MEFVNFYYSNGIIFSDLIAQLKFLCHFLNGQVLCHESDVIRFFVCMLLFLLFFLFCLEQWWFAF